MNTISVNVIRRLKAFQMSRDQSETYLTNHPTHAIVHTGIKEDHYVFSYLVQPDDINPDSSMPYGIRMYRHIPLGSILTYDEIDGRLEIIDRELGNEYE
jgi:hypothetical protein